MKEEIIVCKLCGSNNTRKYGFIEGTQKYFCNDCKRKFSSDDRLFRMKTSADQVSSALDMYYKSMSISEIKDHLYSQYGNNPSSKAIYSWITKYTNEGVKQFKDYHPEVGKTWVADETVIKVDGKNWWVINVLDIDTRFLLAAKLSSNRNEKDIQQAFEDAKNRTNLVPDKILTDGWRGYIEGIESAFGSDAKHIVTGLFDGDETTEIAERYHGTFKDRYKTLRGLKTKETAEIFLNGFSLFYNYLRPHESLNGKTPAEKAKLTNTPKTWIEIIHKVTPKVEVLTTPSKTIVVSEQKPLIRPITHRRYNMSNKKHLRRIHKIQNKRQPRSENVVREMK